MVPLVDTHCHLLPGMDDGPRSWDDALAMCRIAWEDGVRGMAATVHQNETWPEATPAKIRSVFDELDQSLKAEQLPLQVYPAAEVMVTPQTLEDWRDQRLMSMADRGEYLLIELPHGAVLDMRGMISDLVEAGVRPILAHPERYSQFQEDDAALADLIDRGCLVQVSAASVTHPSRPQYQSCAKRWARRRMIHLIGSDGHSPRKRPPGLRAAYEELAAWEGAAYADQVCSLHGMAVLEGLPLRPERPRPARRWWLPKSVRQISR